GQASGVGEPRRVARYRMGREGYVRFLLGARSVSDVLRRRRVFNELLEADLEALATLGFTADGARAARDELAAARNEQHESVQSGAEKRPSVGGRVDQQRKRPAAGAGGQ